MIALLTLLVLSPIAALASEPAPNADYSQYSPPALPTALSEKIQGYLDIRSPGAGMLSPNGKRLFFTWSVTGTNQVWRLDGPKTFPVQMTGGELKTSINEITKDGKWVILSRDRAGEENPGLYRMSTDGGALEVIQHKPKVRTFFGFLSSDSRWLYYRSNDIKPDSYAIYRRDLKNGKTELLIDDPGLWWIMDHKPDGTLLLSKSVGSMQNEVHEWSPVTKKITHIMGKDEKLPFYAQYGAHKGELLVNTFKFGEFFTLFSYRDGKFTQISKKLNWDVEDFEIDEARTKILYTTNENGFTKLHAMDARSFKQIRLPSFPDADHVAFGAIDPKGRRAMISVSTSKAPRVAYSYDFSSRRLQQWVVPSSPEIDTRAFTPAKLETYPARDGTRIPMLVRKPSQCEKKLCPVIVEFHGGPEGQSQPGFSPYAQLYLEEGFIFVQPNVRGSSGYGRTWLDADNGAKRLDVITDIEDVALFIRENWKVNGVAPKIGVAGGSYGGYSTNIAMTMFAGAYDAGVSEVGMSNLVTFIQNTAPYRRILRMNEYGDPATDREVMEKLSPTTHVEKIKGPLLIIQGANDPRVPVSEAVQMLETMKKKGIPGKLIVFPDEGHGTAKRSNRVLAVGNEMQFFIEHLKGE